MRWLLPLLLLLCSCSKNAPAPIPRPQAYPRIELYPEEYKEEAVLGHKLQVNSYAEFIAGSVPGWFDVRYPAYGVTVNATLSPYSPEALENRTERMARNIAGASAELTQGHGITLLVAPTALRTPVQLLATDSLSWILSAVAVTDWPATTPPDSIAPILPALATDLCRLTPMW